MGDTMYKRSIRKALQMGGSNHTPDCIRKVVQRPLIPIFLRDDLQGEEEFLLAETNTFGKPAHKV